MAIVTFSGVNPPDSTTGKGRFFGIKAQSLGRLRCHGFKAQSKLAILILRTGTIFVLVLTHISAPRALRNHFTRGI